MIREQERIGKVFIKSIFETVVLGTLPDGRYEAVWSGYQITWKIDGREFHAKVDKGIRGWDHGFVVILGDNVKFETHADK